jgi:predicted transcriptional regulator
MTVRMPTRLRRRLERLAAVTDRTSSWLAMDAIATYVELHEWQVSAIKEGIAAADAGELVDHARVAAWLSSWGHRRRTRRP